MSSNSILIRGLLIFYVIILSGYVNFAYSIQKTGIQNLLDNESDLRIGITSDNLDAVPGDVFNLIITINNSGPDDATGVSVQAIIPDGYSYISHTDGEPYNQTTGIWTVGSLEADNFAVFQLEVEVNMEGNYLFNASVTSDQTDPTPGDNTDQYRIKLSDLSIKKTVNNTEPLPGEDVIFTLVVENFGPDIATNVVVTDLLPDGYTYVSDNSDGSYNPENGQWNIGSMSNGTSETIDITATVNSSGNYENTATVSAFQHDTFQNDNTDAATVSPQFIVDIQFEKTVDISEPAVFTNVTFTLNITNSGTIEGTDIEVTDQLPDGLLYVSSTSSSSNNYDPVTGIWNPGTIAPNTVVTLEIEAQVLDGGQYLNIASLTAPFLSEPLTANAEVFPRFFPVAEPDFVRLEWLGSATVNVLENDVHPSLDPTSVEIVEFPVSGASAEVTNSGEIFLDYSETPGFTGSEFLVYQVASVEGLTDTALVTIEVTMEELVIPNTFSPNKDNIHDLYVIPGIEAYTESEFTVFNRWGSEVFSMRGYDNSWDGTEQNSGSELPEGTYFFILKFNDILPVEKGYIYLAR